MVRQWVNKARRYSAAASGGSCLLAPVLFTLVMPVPHASAAMADAQACEKYRADMVAAAVAMTIREPYLFDHIFGKREFRDYYDRAGPYADCAADFILNENVDINARVMAMFSIQEIPQDQLFPILDRVVQAASDGKLTLQKSAIFDYSILSAALFPENLNAFLDFYYQEPRSRKVLSNAERIPGLDPGLQKRIDQAQSGEGRERRFVHIEIGQNIRQDYILDGRRLNVDDLIGRRLCALFGVGLAPESLCLSLWRGLG